MPGQDEAWSSCPSPSYDPNVSPFDEHLCDTDSEDSGSSWDTYYTSDEDDSCFSGDSITTSGSSIDSLGIPSLSVLMSRLNEDDYHSDQHDSDSDNEDRDPDSDDQGDDEADDGDNDSDQLQPVSMLFAHLNAAHRRQDRNQFRRYLEALLRRYTEGLETEGAAVDAVTRLLFTIRLVFRASRARQAYLFFNAPEHEPLPRPELPTRWRRRTVHRVFDDDDTDSTGTYDDSSETDSNYSYESQPDSNSDYDADSDTEIDTRPALAHRFCDPDPFETNHRACLMVRHGHVLLLRHVEQLLQSDYQPQWYDAVDIELERDAQDEYGPAETEDEEARSIDEILEEHRLRVQRIQMAEMMLIQQGIRRVVPEWVRSSVGRTPHYLCMLTFHRNTSRPY